MKVEMNSSGAIKMFSMLGNTGCCYDCYCYATQGVVVDIRY